MSKHPNSLDLDRAVPVLDGWGRETDIVTHGRTDGLIWYFDKRTGTPFVAPKPWEAGTLRALFDHWEEHRAMRRAA